MPSTLSTWVAIGGINPWINRPEIRISQKLRLTYSLEVQMGNFLAIVLAFFMFATNPEQAEFEQFVRTTVASKVESGNALVDMFAGGIVSGLAKENTLRKNYYFFSIYTVDLSALALLGQNIPTQLKFVGIANQFFPLEH
jgi:hypothetical protein